MLPDSQPKRSRVVRVVQWGEDPARVVCLLGSSRYQSDFMSVARAYSVNGDIVLVPHVYTQSDGCSLNKDEQAHLKEATRKRIEMADLIFVINPNNIIPESVHREIEYAESLGRQITYLEKPA